MSQKAENQSVAQQPTTPQPNPPQSGAEERERLDEQAAMFRLAEKSARLLRRLNHPHARNHSARKPPAGSGASSVSQAKNYLRATRPRASKFLRSAPDRKRHARKCAICHHPEREMIEELFIHWHNPRDIADQLDDYDNVNRLSIYRHAYALGLDAIRRRNLGYVFEHILDSADDAAPTAAGVVAAARALSCITEDGRWVEPEKRITMTTIVRKEDSDATMSTEHDPSPASTKPSHDSANPVPPPNNQTARAAPVGADHDRPGLPMRPATVRSGTREIRLPLNSHKTKHKRISNR
ncbi:MAG TPA: hypothetical protein VJN21_03630 [Candidatus Acidoferrales bacterium]|nr:hypothetical protein [Candidatus Acidoferrales bacterium]